MKSNAIIIMKFFSIFYKNFYHLNRSEIGKTVKKNKKQTEIEEFKKKFPYLSNLEPKLLRKEIQKIKNRVSAQNHRDKQKSDLLNFKEENRQLKLEIESLLQKNELLKQRLQKYKCEKCGFQAQTPFDDKLDDEIKRVSNYQRVSSNSCLLKFLTIFSVIFLFSLHNTLSLFGGENNKEHNKIIKNEGNNTFTDENKENSKYPVEQNEDYYKIYENSLDNVKYKTNDIMRDKYNVGLKKCIRDYLNRNDGTANNEIREKNYSGGSYKPSTYGNRLQILKSFVSIIIISFIFLIME